MKCKEFERLYPVTGINVDLYPASKSLISFIVCSGRNVSPCQVSTNTGTILRSGLGIKAIIRNESSERSSFKLFFKS
jgi:hypothetical protein